MSELLPVGTIVPVVSCEETALVAGIIDRTDPDCGRGLVYRVVDAMTGRVIGFMAGPAAAWWYHVDGTPEGSCPWRMVPEPLTIFHEGAVT